MGARVALAERLAGLSSGELAVLRERLVLDGFSTSSLEGALADAAAVGWRADPWTMARELDGAAIEDWAYTRFLARKFRDAATGRSPRQVWNLPAQVGKPVSVDALVLMGDGSRHRLADVNVGDDVIGVSGRPCRVKAVHEQGWRTAVKVTTHGGRSTIAAVDHPFLTADGWVNAEDLVVGQVLASVDPLCATATSRLPEEFRMAGYFIGDGSVTTGPRGSMNAAVTCADPIEAVDLEHCARVMGWEIRRVNDKGSRADRFSFSKGVRKWLRAAEIAGHGSATKRVPAWVFTAPDAMVAEFVGAYVACDGSVYGGVVEAYSVSRGLLDDVQHLLLRLGIQSKVRPKKGRYAAQVHDSWRLSILDADNVARFADRVPMRSVKSAALSDARRPRNRFDGVLIPDLLVSVERVGEVECRCLTVESDESFTADDLVVHNSTWLQRGILWALDQNPARKMLYLTYGDSLAVEGSDFIRQQARRHADVLRFELRADRQNRNRWKTPEGGGLLATGIGGGVAGFGGSVIIDDPIKNWADAHSKAARDRAWNEITAVGGFRLAEGDFMILAHTRWHLDDPTGRMLEFAKINPGEGWEFVTLPMFARDNDPIGRVPGQVLEPRRYTEQAARSRALLAGSYLASAIEQQDPQAEQGGEVLREWWKWSATFPPRFDEVLVSWDMKLKDKESGDYVVGVVAARIGTKFWVLDMIRGQFSQLQTKVAICTMALRYPGARKHIIENTGNGPEVINELRSGDRSFVLTEHIASKVGVTATEAPVVQQMIRRGLQGIIGNSPREHKLVRARRVIPSIEGGHVTLPENTGWTAQFVDEWAAFPPRSSGHDDIVDATTQAIDRLTNSKAAVLSTPATPINVPLPKHQTVARAHHRSRVLR